MFNYRNAPHAQSTVATGQFRNKEAHASVGSRD